MKEEENKVVYGKLGEREELQVVGIVDASFKPAEKAIAGMIIVLTNKDMTKASPLMWKAKQIDGVCLSSKDAETVAMLKIIDELVYMSKHVEILLYGDYQRWMNVRIITDSEPTLESIGSTRQIDRKQLRGMVSEMKDKLTEGEITSYQWVSTKDIWADKLTKEKSMSEGVRKLLKQGTCSMVQKEENKVVNQDGDVKKINVRTRRQIQFKP